MRFLVVRLSAMGDVVCTLPVASALKTLGPEVHVTWAVQPVFAPLVERCESVDEVVTFFAKDTRLTDELKRIRDLEPFDAVIDAQGLAKSAVLAGAARAKRRLGYHWQREGAGLFTQRVRPDASSLHVVDQYVDVARALGAQVHRAHFGLNPRPADLDEAATLVGHSTYAVIHPGGGWATKRWPAKDFAAVATTLVAQGFTPVLIGTRPEEGPASEIQDLCPSVVNLVNKTSIGTLVGLISKARIHIGGDTGSTHIAAALNIPCVGIYTVTKPVRSCPYGQFSHCPDPSQDKVIQMVKRLV